MAIPASCPIPALHGLAKKHSLDSCPCSVQPCPNVAAPHWLATPIRAAGAALARCLPCSLPKAPTITRMHATWIPAYNSVRMDVTLAPGAATKGLSEWRALSGAPSAVVYFLLHGCTAQNSLWRLHHHRSTPCWSQKGLRCELLQFLV